jgi:hypothetical protein
VGADEGVVAGEDVLEDRFVEAGAGRLGAGSRRRGGRGELDQVAGEVVGGGLAAGVEVDLAVLCLMAAISASLKSRVSAR